VPVSVDVPDDLFVRGDPFLLHLALSNLVQNAIDFSPPGASVTVTGAREADQAVVRIADAGPGIPEFARERVFEKFFSLERPGTGKKSTGLGLNFVKEIAALHHGQVVLDNRREGGLCAVLSFPVAAA
jgi:two-component system sensor histidine kinase CreC